MMSMNGVAIFSQAWRTRSVGLVKKPLSLLVALGTTALGNGAGLKPKRSISISELTLTD